MNGRILEFNQPYAKMLGYQPEELKKLTYFDLTPSRWHPIEAQIVANQVLKRGYSEIYEKEYIRRDGSVFPIELRTVLLTDGDGKPTGMWAIVRDITKRKRDETEREKLLEEVRNRATELEATLSAIPEGFQIFGPNLQILRQNEVAERVLGISHETARLSLIERMEIVRLETADGVPLAPDAHPGLGTRLVEIKS
jgi:PAS domain S-box-containing protein